MNTPGALDTPTTPDHRHSARAEDVPRESARESARESPRESPRAPPSASACDAIVASDDINKETALRVQKLVHDMQVAHMRQQDSARREVEAARNEIALMRLSGEHAEEIECMRAKLIEVERILGAQQEMLGSVARSVEELSAIVPKPKRR